MLSPSLAVVRPVLATARAEGWPTVEPGGVGELLAGLGSLVLPVTDAVSEKLAPGARLAGAETTRLKVSELPEAMLAPAVSVTVPPDGAKVKASLPIVCVI